MTKGNAGVLQGTQTIAFDQQLLKKLFDRAELYTQRYLKTFMVPIRYLAIIRTIYRILIIPENWINKINFTDKQLLAFVVTLNLTINVHPLQELAKDKLIPLFK